MNLLTAQPNDVLGAPMVPPSGWFSEIPDGFDPINANDPLIWVGTEGDQVGRFAALVAPDDACILDGREKRGRCLRPPTEPSSYDFAHIGATLTDDGEIATGRIAGGINHFGDGDASMAGDHYANTGRGLARVRYVHDAVRGGLFAIGALDPSVTVWESLMLRACALSGDWRWVEELNGMRLAGAQAVNVPGFRPIVDRSPTRASCSYMLAAMGENAWQSRFDVVPITAEPKFDESKHSRDAGGKFASKDNAVDPGQRGDSAKKPTLDEVLAKARANSRQRPGGRAGRGSKAKGGGRAKPTEQQKAAEKAAKDAESAAKRLAKQEADRVAKHQQLATDIGNGVDATLMQDSYGEAGNADANAIAKQVNEASKLLKANPSGAANGTAVEILNKARQDALAAVEKYKGSADESEQRLVENAATTAQQLGSQIKKLDGATQANEAAARARAASNARKAAKQRAAPAFEAARSARMFARHDAMSAAMERAQLNRARRRAITTTKETTMETNCTDCIAAGLELLDASVFVRGDEVTDADGGVWIVAGDETSQLADGTPLVALVATIQELDIWPRMVTMIPADELAGTGRRAQWVEGDEDVDSSAVSAMRKRKKHKMAAGAEGEITAAAGDGAPDESEMAPGETSSAFDAALAVGELRQLITELASKVSAIEEIVAADQADKLSVVDLVEAMDQATA